jgi:hypothetical protein
MLKMILVVAATAAPAFGAGIWTASTMAHDHSIEANRGHLKVVPSTEFQSMAPRRLRFATELLTTDQHRTA